MIEVKNMTSLFTKELMLYSIFDIRFKTPKRVIFFVYSIINLLLWSPILIYIFRNNLNIYTLSFIFVPPLGLAQLMSKPIWNNKSFHSWLICQIKFLLSNKNYYDLRNLKDAENVIYNINSVFTVIRTKDYFKLYNYLLERKGNNF